MDQTLIEVKFEQDTRDHVNKVRANLNLIIKDLIDRSAVHDESKWSEQERPLFIEHTPTLAALTYGSPEYYEALKKLQPALDHHYQVCDHHPNHFQDNFYSMHLGQIIECFADWLAATQRHNDGDIYKSIKHNQKRFEMSDQLVRIFENTAKWYEAQK
jgi:hypothetical protein